MLNFNILDFVKSPRFVQDCCTFSEASIAENSIEVVEFYMDLLESI